MSLDKATVKKVARLARIRMEDADLDKAHDKINNIMAMIEQLGEVDTENVDPLPSPVDITQRTREDVVNDGGYAKDVLANAPEEMEDFYVVPKVVE